MKSIRVHRKGFISACVLLILLINMFPVKASENQATKNQILFMLDGSKSMGEEQWQEAIDSIAMITSMLPSDYQTAVMVYSKEVNSCTEFGTDIKAQLEELRTLEQQGYTNTGVALESALQKFSKNTDGKKRIVIISDGEISMKEDMETKQAVAIYNTSISQAVRRQVIVDVLLFETEDMEEQIIQGAESTGGYIFRRTKENTIQKFAEKYLFEQLEMDKIMLGLSDSSNNAVEISLQDTFMRRARVLLTADSEIEDIQISCQSKNAQVIRGENFAVINLEQPLEENIKLQYSLSEKGQMNAYLVKEYDFSVDVETIYNQDISQYILKVNIVDAEGRDVLTDSDIAENVGIYLNGKRTSFAVEQGLAVIHYPLEATQEVTVKVEFKDLNSKVFCIGEERKLLLEVPVVELEEEDNTQYIWIYVVVTCVGVVFILLMILYFQSQRKKKRQSGEKAQKANDIEEVLSYDFSGKIVLYVLKSEEMQDIPPASVNLYARKNKESFNFAWVLERCHIRMCMEDADKIQFYGGEDHTLCIRNMGDATVVKGREILLRNKKYFLSYNEKILMIFNDGEIEIEIHYKNIKPSER